MMFKMIPSNVKLFKKKSVKMSPKVIQLSKSVLNGLFKSVRQVLVRLRSIAQKQNVRRFHERFADLVPPKFPELKNVSIERKLLSKKFLTKLVTWNHKRFANMSLSWYLSSNPLKNVLIFQRKCALAQEPTQERFKSLSSRNGATYQLLNLVWLKNILGYISFLVTLLVVKIIP